MKSIGHVSLLRWDDLRLKVPAGIARTLGIEAGTKLWGMVFRTPSYSREMSAASTRTHASAPAATDCPELSAMAHRPPEGGLHTSVLLTPFPPRVWGTLLRACFTLTQGPGQLAALTERLRELGLFVRTIDSSDGMNTSRYSHHVSHDGELTSLDDTGFRESVHVA